jgi:adenine-specific DNA-methyltransferase
MKPQATYRKLRGVYYTPPDIAKFLSRWAIRSASDRVLEPSCGDGIFLEMAAKQLCGLGAASREAADQIWAYEIDPIEAGRAAERIRQLEGRKHAVHVYCEDFFGSFDGSNPNRQFDAVVGNPPFVRYQNFPEEQRSKAFEIMERAGLHPNRLTNTWVPFVVGAALLLKPQGRLAMVVPAELLQVNYASELRVFLTRFFHQITVLTFRNLAFGGIQQEVVLLLALRDASSKKGIEVLELQDAAELTKYEPRSFGNNGFRSIDHTTEKWTQYYLSQREIDLLRSLRSDTRLTKLGSLADTDIGIVTGMNEVFVVSEGQVAENGLGAFVRSLVGRSAQLQGTTFTNRDWKANRDSGQKVYLLDLPSDLKRDELPSAVHRYLRSAETRKLHLGYKCRIRKPWYTVPSVYVPSAFLLRQIHQHPKLIVNEASAVCTDTIHRVRFRGQVDGRALAAAFLNSLTFAFSEVLGRSYGGGVLELEPNEADLLPVPLLNSERLDPVEIDALVRQSNVEAVLQRTDSVLLAGGLHLTEEEIRATRSVWDKLKRRRIGRRTTVS